MKIGVLICALLLTVSATPAAAETTAFEQARRIGEAQQRSFFLFTTSFGRYIIRHDGMGEVTANGRRKVLYFKVGKVGRVERVYFHEYQGDLLLLYEVSDGVGYFARVNQQTRKMRLTPVRGKNIGPCIVEGDAAYFATSSIVAKIDLKTGSYLWQTEIDTGIEEFQLPVIKENVVIFAEEAANGRSIQVSKMDGAVQSRAVQRFQ